MLAKYDYQDEITILLYRMASLVNFFLVTFYRVGPNSPIGWIRENILQIIPEHSEKRKKILLGLNFYGYDFGGTSGVQCKLKHLIYFKYCNNTTPVRIYHTKEFCHAILIKLMEGRHHLEISTYDFLYGRIEEYLL